ncbi:helix-turn-helix domain-containing protein [Gaetbulibacter sp. M235]|uniref:helix-turn-helix domain-containing protein n=1 Tax=Gaetbulibacter sp. M235 TaxID=3126510 RepID=UPI00374F03A9
MQNIHLNTFQKSDFDKAFDEAFEKAIIRAFKEYLNPPKASDPDMFSRKQTAKKLCVSLPTLHDWTKEGIIRAYRIGNRVLYKKEDINQALTLINPQLKRGGKSC